jgi:hypothetical protein
MNAKKEFVVRIILSAKTGEVFICFRIKAANGLEVTDRRSEI